MSEIQQEFLFEDIRRCVKCKITKNIYEFYVHKSSRGGRRARCKICCVKDLQVWLKKSKNRRLKQMRTRRWAINNKDAVRKHRRQWDSSRKATDKNYVLRCNLRNRMSSALQGRAKVGSCINDLGCPVDFLRKHIESLFEEGMNWQNYGIKEGQWSIDHIMPLSVFNLEDRQEYLLACHYLNLRPMWHKDNRIKYNKMPKLFNASKT